MQVEDAGGIGAEQHLAHEAQIAGQGDQLDAFFSQLAQNKRFTGSFIGEVVWPRKEQGKMLLSREVGGPAGFVADQQGELDLRHCACLPEFVNAAKICAPAAGKDGQADRRKRSAFVHKRHLRCFTRKSCSRNKRTGIVIHRLTQGSHPHLLQYAR